MPTLPRNKPAQPAAPSLRQLIIQWNNKYPWDYLWRKRNNVPWGSPTHLGTSFLSMGFELREAQLYENKRIELQNERRAKPLTPAQKLKLLKPPVETEESRSVTDEEFNDLDLSDFNDPAK